MKNPVIIIFQYDNPAFEKRISYVRDFKGSMMRNIESMFRSFGGKLTPYSKIYKGGNVLFQFLNAIKKA